MLQIVLIRPGATHYDEQGRIQGTLDIPLSASGMAAISRLAEELRGRAMSIIYAAPGQASWQTASIIAGAQQTKVKEHNGLQNLNHGLWQGMQLEEIRRKHPKVFRQWQEQPENICPPQGEMLADAQRRVEFTLGKLLRKHRTGTFGIVVPEPLATLVHSYLTHEKIGHLWKLGSGGALWESIKLDQKALFHRGVQVKQEISAEKPEPLPMGIERTAT